MKTPIPTAGEKRCPTCGALLREVSVAPPVPGLDRGPARYGCTGKVTHGWGEFFDLRFHPTELSPDEARKAQEA